DRVGTTPTRTPSARAWSAAADATVWMADPPGSTTTSPARAARMPASTSAVDGLGPATTTAPSSRSTPASPAPATTTPAPPRAGPRGPRGGAGGGPARRVGGGPGGRRPG